MSINAAINASEAQCWGHCIAPGAREKMLSVDLMEAGWPGAEV